MIVSELILETAIKESGDVCDVRLEKAFAEGLLEILREYNTLHHCLKEKCCICPHCRDCDVDDKGKIKGRQDAVPVYEDKINVLPTEQGRIICNRWISVKDGLPEEHSDEHPYEFEQYLCVTVWNYVRTIGFGTRIGGDKPHFWSGNSIWDDWVTHWMPLPEPPEKEK